VGLLRSECLFFGFGGFFLGRSSNYISSLLFPPAVLSPAMFSFHNVSRMILTSDRSLTHRAKVEESAWLEVANFYNTYRSTVLADLDKRLAPQPPSTPSSTRTPSAKAKGKQRASSQEVEDWSSPREYELPEVFRGEEGVGLARGVVGIGGGGEEGRKSPLSARLEGLEFKVRAYLNSFSFDSGCGAETGCIDERTGRQPPLLFKLRTANHKCSYRRPRRAILPPLPLPRLAFPIPPPFDTHNTPFPPYTLPHLLPAAPTSNADAVTRPTGSPPCVIALGC
jgi:hypothetical protein